MRPTARIICASKLRRATLASRTQYPGVYSGCKTLTTTIPHEVSESNDSDISIHAAKRFPKKKVALVVAYDGTKFVGSMHNPHKPTVDGALVKALLDAELIDSQNAYNFEKLLWSRASRTDRGVHASCNIVTVKVRVPISAYDSTRHSSHIVDEINKHLPGYVRVLDAVHTTALMKPLQKTLTNIADNVQQHVPANEAERCRFELEQILSDFIGTKHFHNFTVPSTRASHVTPRHKQLWEQLNIHPSSSKQPNLETKTKAALLEHEEDVEGGVQYMDSLNDNTFTRLYAAVHEENSEFAAHKNAENWDYDTSVTRTIYEFSAAVVAEARDLLPKYVTSPIGFRKGEILYEDLTVNEWTAISRRQLDNNVPLDTMVRLTVHGSSFMLHQIRFMVGTALAIYHGLLPREYIRVATCLPCLHRLPLAPPSGLLQAEVNFASTSYITMYHPPGTDDAEPPMVSVPAREAMLNDPHHANPMLAATFAADIALLRNDGQTERRQFFMDHLLPKLRSFCALDGKLPSGGGEISPMQHTCLQWLCALTREIPQSNVVDAAMNWFALHSQQHERHAAQRQAIELRKQKEVAAMLWSREGKTPPISLPRPIHLSEAGKRTSQRKMFNEEASDLRLQKCRLAEIRKMLLPNSTATCIAIATKITRHADLNHIIRAICWRMAQVEWPVIGTAAQHAEWVVQSDPAVLMREGKILYWIERAEARNAATHDYYMRKMKKMGKAVEDEWGKHAVPLAPLQDLYAESFPVSRGGLSNEAELGKEEFLWKKDMAQFQKLVRMGDKQS